MRVLQAPGEETNRDEPFIRIRQSDYEDFVNQKVVGAGAFLLSF